MIFLQVIFDLLGCIFQKISLYMLRMYQGLHLPDQMDMVRHNSKCIKFDTLIFYQEAETVYYYILILIVLQ